MTQAMICPMVTAVDSQGRINEESNAKQIERLIEGGVNGILFLGSIGEFAALSFERKKAFLRFAIPLAKGRVRVIAGTACPAVEETLELNRIALECGADAAMILPPYYFPASQEEVFQYYATLAENSGIPLMMYNFPNTTGVNITPETVRRLAEKYHNIVGIKDTVDNISHTRGILQAVLPVRPDFEVYSGFDEYAMPNLLLGGSGVISGMNNLAPQIFQQLLKAVQAGDFAAMQAAQNRISALMPIYQALPSFVQAIKLAVSMLLPGYEPHMSLSCPPAGESDLRRIREILIGGGLLEK